MKLPEKFIEQMKTILGPNWDDFYKTYDHPAIKGIRVNTLKISVQDFMELAPFKLKAVPWTRNGFYVEPDISLGKDPYYFAGLYYIQEPSAMLPAELLNPDEDDVVLDLCAAPGGKTMQLADMMGNEGLLVANDINNHRLKGLIRNAELMGLKNLIVLNEHQMNIANQLKGFVDKLLIDAPCSGEGMFKKHADARRAYEDYDIEACKKMQKEILDDIMPVLNSKGSFVYSTCTFNTQENEEMLLSLKDRSPITIKEIPLNYGFEPGIQLKGPVRLYPHKVRGEGHFAALGTYRGQFDYKAENLEANEPPDLLQVFMDQYLNTPLEGHFNVYKDQVYLMPKKTLDFKGLKVVKAGWYLGKLAKNRFEPSHAFALGLKSSQFKNIINFKRDDVEVVKYLKCETLHCSGEKGYNLVCVDGYPLGWGKWAQGKLKNLYPSPWRLS